MSTPPPQSARNGKRKIKMSAEMKQGLIDNFDLEVANRLEMLTSIHLASLSSFLTRQETAIQRIPLEMRRMTVKEIGDRWSGGIRGVMDGLTRGRLEVEEQGREDEEGAGGAGVREGGKRKRPTTASQLSMPIEKDSSRLPKSARKNPFTDATQTSTTPGPSRKTKKNLASSPTKSTATTTSSTAPFASSVFKFNPLLPATPLVTNAKGYRRPRRNESIVMSTNGSPLIIGDAAADGEGEASGSGSEAEEDEEELLDEEEEMRRLEGRAVGKVDSGSKGKGKARPSSIQLLPSQPPPTTNLSNKPIPSFSSNPHPASPSALNLLIPIPLPNGQTLSFNALSDSPTKLDDFLRAEGLGVSDEERGRIRGQIDRSVRMLGERLGKWKIGGS